MAHVVPDAKRDGSAVEDDAEPRSDLRVTGRRRRLLGLVRLLFGLVLFALVVLAVGRSWDDVRSTLVRAGPLEIVAAEILVLAGLGASVLTWRAALRELGSEVRLDAAARIYLLGQLGKYLPGSVWALAVQMELAKRAGVSRGRGMAASIVAIAVNVVTGLVIGFAVVPSVLRGSTWLIVAVAAALAVCAVGLSPAALTRLVDLGLRFVRRAPLERKVTWQGLLTAAGWSTVSWLSYGTSVWVLAVAVGAPAGESLPLCLAGTALAMTAGFLVVVAPSGVGVREAVVVAALTPVLDPPEALAVALAARLLFTLADLIAAAAVLPVRMDSSRPTESSRSHR